MFEYSNGVTEWWQASDAELLAALGQSNRELNAAYLGVLEVVAEVSARGLGGKEGFVTDVELLRCAQNLTRPEAKRRIAAARDVLPGRTSTGEVIPAVLAQTGQAVAEHAVSAEHVAVIQRILAAVPAHLDAHRVELEARLAGWARTFDVAAVHQLGRRALEVLDADGPKPRDTDPARTRLSLSAQGQGYAIGGWLDREAHATLMTALSPLAAPRPAADGSPDPRTVAERQGEALEALARRMLDSATLPLDGGHRPHITLTVPLTVLEDRLGFGLLDFGDTTLAGAIAAEDARRLACDAQVATLVINGRNQPLDIGRRNRVVPRAMRRALAARDGGCAFPGCDIPAQWADAHHIIHWADLGPTAVDNLVLLCGRHHTLIHNTDWAVTITDGLPTFHPPAWIPGGSRRNPLHRIDLLPAANCDAADAADVRLQSSLNAILRT